jgi:hypothetical protein
MMQECKTAYKLKHLHDSLYYQRIFVSFTLRYVTYLYPYRSLSPVIIRVWSVLHNIAGEAEKKNKFAIV